MANKKYSDDSIQVLDGLEHVRKRCGMYIGSTDERGLHHLIWEIVDNAIDEAMMGFGNKINITLHKDGSCSVEDFGRGIPNGVNKETGRSTPEVIYTVLNSGGKFNDESYSGSVGLHGVGAAVVTALSTFVEITTCRDGIKYHQVFEKGGKKIHKPERTSIGSKTGTICTFHPDPEIFPDINFKFSLVSERLQEDAFLLPGVEFNLIDERNDKRVSFKYDEGLKAFVKYIAEGKEALTPIIQFKDSYKITVPADISKGTKEETYFFGVDVVLQYVNTYDETLVSFCNNVKTGDGGSHVTGFRSAYTKTLNAYGAKYNLIKDKDRVGGDDYKEGLIAIVSVKVPEKFLQFEGQTKNKLGTPEAKNAVENVISEKLGYFLEENKQVAETIIGKAKKASNVREAARKAREEARNGKKKKEERLISDKLVPCHSKKSIDNELFLVEGDSAGGSAKQGRNSSFQAILPLRGKVINSEKNDIEDLLKNEEISTMIYTIGAGYGQEFNLADSNYGKVIIMTDADTDGAHIQVLLLAFFFKYMRPLVEAGRVFVALPPLYKVFKANKIIYCWDDEQLEDAKKKIGQGYSVQRYKGLGEMNPGQLWETTMDPKSRSLVQVTIDDLIVAEHKMNVLMGKDSKIRREWIEENVKFTLEDNYVKEGE